MGKGVWIVSQKIGGLSVTSPEISVLGISCSNDLIERNREEMKKELEEGEGKYFID